MVGKSASARERMQLLWVVLSSRWGGPEQVAMSDMVDLTRAGLPVALLCLEGSPVHAAALRHPHLQVLPVRSAPRGFWDLLFFRELRAVVSRSKANVIHLLEEGLLWYLAPILWRHPEISVVATRHVPAERSLLHFLRAFFLRRLDSMIVLSESIKQSVLARKLLTEKRIRVINLGLDFTRFDPAKVTAVPLRQSWGVDDDTILIGSVGRMVPEVGQETFIKAAAGLLKYDQWKLRFAIIGEEPIVTSEEYMASLRELVKTFHMDSMFVFGSLADNLPEVMAAFDVFVMPGREEVPGLGALEAISMERPVVVSNVVGAEEIVGNRQYGLLVRPEDAFDLQQKLLNLLENLDSWRARGKLGRTHVLRLFDRNTRMRRSLELYERCVRRRLFQFADTTETL